MVFILAKLDLNLENIKECILSPGDIFWQQKSGPCILVSAKSGFLNIQLIEKLFKANQCLFIENQIDLKIDKNFVENFKKHQREILIKEKLRWRSKLMSLFSEEFSVDGVSQFDVDLLAWKVFFRLSHEESQKFLENDIELFKRSMSVATSYTLCAFLLGYYDDEFLSQIFTETFLNLMDLKASVLPQTAKMELEKIRLQESLQFEDREILEGIYPLINKKNTLLTEYYDGSGVKQINAHEMTDLELVFVALNNHYSYSGIPHQSIFGEIKNGLFKCDIKILNILKKYMKVCKPGMPIGISA